MMRLNPAPRLNLHVGQRVQSDIDGEPEAVYIVHTLYEHPEASGGFAAMVTREDGKPVAVSATAACWFWPEGVLAAVTDDAKRVERLERELSDVRYALVTANRERFTLGQTIQRIREAVAK